MSIYLTAVYRKVSEGYIGLVEELPEARAQGETIEEVREKLRKAVDMTLEANRVLARKSVEGEEVLSELLNGAPPDKEPPTRR